jgi:hypothetical protein
MIVPAVTRLLAAGGAFEGERLSHAANPCADACPTSKRRRPAPRDTPGEAGVVVRNWRWNSTSGAGKSKDWEDRNRCRSHCVRDGHRFESPQLHQEVGANRRDFLRHRIARHFREPHRQRELGHAKPWASVLAQFLETRMTKRRQFELAAKPQTNKRSRPSRNNTFCSKQ